MRTTLLFTLLTAAGITQVACAEAVAPLVKGTDLDIVVPGVERMQPQFLLEDEPPPAADPPPQSDELPPEFQTAPSIWHAETEAEFRPSAAWGQSLMRYYGSHARQTLKLVLRFNNAQVANPSFTSGVSEHWAGDRSLLTTGKILATKDCGHVLDATSEHIAWHQFPLVGSWSKWGETTVPSDKSAQQQPCAPDSGDGGGGGGGGGGPVYVCYCLDYYNERSGEWEHGGIIYCLEA